jgi:hypothetical protein
VTRLLQALLCALPAAAAAAEPPAQWLDAVVEIGDAAAPAAGFFIDAEGRIATSARAVGDAPRVAVRARDGAEQTGDVIARDATRDLALVRVPSPARAFLAFGSAGRAGDEIVVLAPGKASPQSGAIAALQVIDDVDYVEMARVAPGMDGAPVIFPATGDAIGVRVRKARDAAEPGGALAVAAPEFDEAFGCALRLGGRCDATNPPSPEEIARVQAPPKRESRPEREPVAKRESAGALEAARRRNAEAEEYVRITGTRVSLRRPTGMVKSRDSAGLTTPDGKLRITVTEVHRPLADASKSYTEPELGKVGIRLLGREDLHIAERPGFIAYAAQGKQTALWLAAFGEGDESVVLAASAPLERAKEVSDLMHATLVSARWERDAELDAFAGLDWELTGTLRLKLAQRVLGDLTFTRDGSLPTDDTWDEPVLTIGKRAGRIEENARADTCREAIEKTNGVREVSGLEIAETSREGLPGCEMAATAIDQTSGKGLILYQVILFDGSGRYWFRGRVGVNKQYRYLPELLEMVKRFKRRG